MKYRHCLTTSKKWLQSFRCFSDGPSDSFRDKGVAEENRYFLRKQEEELKKLRQHILRLAKNQEKLQTHLEQTKNEIRNLRDKDK